MVFSRLVRILAACLLLAAPALAAPLTLTGEVYYRERMALPSGATLHVGLVTLPGGRPVVGAGASVTARGQVPIAFTLNIHSDVAALGGAFGLVAEIKLNGQVLFRSAEAVPVDVARPKPVSILVTRQAQKPVDPTPPAPNPALLDTVWRVTSIGGKPVVSGARPITLSIASDLRASGSGGCNNYVTEATVLASKLIFGPAAATRMACAEPMMAQESAYFAALAAVAGFELDDTSLRLLDPAGIPLVGLVRQEN